jgi:hypothetical protein
MNTERDVVEKCRKLILVMFLGTGVAMKGTTAGLTGVNG